MIQTSALATQWLSSGIEAFVESGALHVRVPKPMNGRHIFSILKDLQQLSVSGIEASRWVVDLSQQSKPPMLVLGALVEYSKMVKAAGGEIAVVHATEERVPSKFRAQLGDYLTFVD
jgi:hypothetical protein